MFGKKKPTEHNVILLDIENASVGVALAHLSEGRAPVLFAESRTPLALPHALHSGTIAKQIEKAAHEALQKLGLVAARLRGNEATAHKGQFTKAAVFLGAPWGVPNLALGKSVFSSPMQNFLTSEIRSIANILPVSFYTGADAASYGSTLLHPGSTSLVAIVRGEIIELVLLGEQGPLGYATLPIGSRSLYRTLQTHAGLSLAEIPAALALIEHSNPYSEPIEAAGRHIVGHVAPAVEALIHNGAPQSMIVIAEEPLGPWFARALEADESLGALFLPNSTIRTIGGRHAARHLGGHAQNPDLHLGLDALFMQGKSFGFNTI